MSQHFISRGKERVRYAGRGDGRAGAWDLGCACWCLLSARAAGSSGCGPDWNPKHSHWWGHPKVLYCDLGWCFLYYHCQVEPAFLTPVVYEKWEWFSNYSIDKHLWLSHIVKHQKLSKLHFLLIVSVCVRILVYICMCAWVWVCGMFMWCLYVCV